MQEIVVDLGERSYPIQIGAGLLLANPRLHALCQGRRVALVTDAHVDALFGDALARDLGPIAAHVERIVMPPGEQTKDWSSVNTIVERLLQARFDRRSLIVAVGGGVVGDLAGFVAAIYQRGIDFVQVPTTLLAQVDSSVGGKTAINHPLGKNMIGAFHQPRLVIADTGTLQHLPARELAAGLAEVIKHGAIADAVYFGAVADALPALLRRDADALTDAVAGSVRIKSAVVADDEREAGARALLNFGHTFGHAIEAGSGYGRWLHGEAVGAGMVVAATMSRLLGRLPPADCDRLQAVVAAAGLPTTIPDWPVARYVSLMSVDKKAESGMPKFIILDAIGRAASGFVPPETVSEALSAHVG
ncbi:MAG: 3-dehydroquinate synthase [Lautropia sp.]